MSVTKGTSWDDLEDGSFDVPAHEWSSSQASKKVVQTDFSQVEARQAAYLLSLGSGASVQENRNQVAMFKCDACRGSGRFVRGRLGYERDYGPCNKCKGTGKLKTDPEVRAKQKKAREDKKKAAAGSYIAAHVAEYTWAVSNLRFDFARSMCEAIKQHGSWTEGQLAAIRRCMARDEERKAAKEAQIATAPSALGVGLDRMLAAFTRAKASGLKYPKLRLGDLSFQPPGPTSGYKDGLFVKCDGIYIGRIDDQGKWLPARGRTTVELDARVLKACKDPLAAAVLHGKQTGHCACCGLELTNDESVRLGIGPICREKWGL